MAETKKSHSPKQAETFFVLLCRRQIMKVKNISKLTIYFVTLTVNMLTIVIFFKWRKSKLNWGITLAINSSKQNRKRWWVKTKYSSGWKSKRQGSWDAQVSLSQLLASFSDVFGRFPAAGCSFWGTYEKGCISPDTISRWSTVSTQRLCLAVPALPEHCQAQAVPVHPQSTCGTPCSQCSCHQDKTASWVRVPIAIKGLLHSRHCETSHKFPYLAFLTLQRRSYYYLHFQRKEQRLRLWGLRTSMQP